MPRIETDLLNNDCTVSLQDLLNAGLNAFAFELVVESYRAFVRDNKQTPVLRFAWDGVAISVQAFVPETASDMEANSSGPATVPQKSEKEKLDVKDQAAAQ